MNIEDFDPGSLSPNMITNLTKMYKLNLSEDLLKSWVYNEDVIQGPYDDFISAGNLINKYYLWVIFAVGFPGNLATLITICRMRRLGPFILYVALLAIGDNLAIFVKLLFYQLLSRRVNVGDAGCRLLQFFGCFLMTYCNWILVLMAVERLIAVKFPFKIQFQSFLNSRKAAVILFSMGFVIAGANIPFLWTTTYTTTDWVCNKNDTDLVNVVKWTSTTLYAILPFIILVVCNILIVREIRLSFKLRSAFQGVNTLVLQKGMCDVPIQRQIMFMLFTTTFMFVVLHFPQCAFLVADLYWKPVEASPIKYLCAQLAYVTCDSNHAVNFYLYFFSARKFRSHFMNLFRCSKKKRKNNTRLALWQMRAAHPAEPGLT